MLNISSFFFSYGLETVERSVNWSCSLTELKCLRSQKIQCTQVPIVTFCRQTQLTPYQCTSGQDRWLPDLCQQVSNLSVSLIHFHLQFQFKLNSKEIEMLFAKSELNMLLCVVLRQKHQRRATSDSDNTLKFALWMIRKYSQIFALLFNCLFVNNHVFQDRIFFKSTRACVIKLFILLCTVCSVPIIGESLNRIYTER